jgi:hypothetical protein
MCFGETETMHVAHSVNSGCPEVSHFGCPTRVKKKFAAGGEKGKPLICNGLGVHLESRGPIFVGTSPFAGAEMARKRL